MRIVLREDVENLGNKGDLLEVADGYARNFLVPRGLAIQATRGVVKQADAMKRNRSVRDARDRSSAQELADKLATQRIEVAARAGEGGKLFGSVGSIDVVAAVLAQTGVELDRRKVQLGDPVKELGAVEVPVKLHPEVEVTLNVEIVAS